MSHFNRTKQISRQIWSTEYGKMFQTKVVWFKEGNKIGLILNSCSKIT